MYNVNTTLMSELIENGSVLKSIEKSIDGLDEIINNMNDRIKGCETSIPEMILQNHLILVKEQREILKNKRKDLLDRRKELTDKIETDVLNGKDYDNMIDTIDRIVMKLLAIDDIYSETHHVSNSSIMSFVEDLLKKKKNLLVK